ncbi:MAG TPA: hypothetical protein VFV67_14690 [Actinophytocola sp.]|uniref:hypothetical protein n=1 Tax=Actinophytocola sp. TaxID=1872138 RepID=UPI002DBA4060|nr:hypothetical protein [Actinophytocola sp.]HEU5471896.1 hypothetical protein [Actinophytocola sp.]
MPVSRKRKKKSGRSGRSRVPARVNVLGAGADLGEQDRRELADAWRGLAAYREQIGARRASLAAAAATNLLANLVVAVANQPDMVVEDALCLRLGTLLGEAAQSPVDDRMGPHDVAQALVTAAMAEVEATTGQADAWHAPWRVLTAVAGILPYPDSEAAVDAIARLRDTEGGRVLPATPPGPAVTGPVLWTRDRYGSRFAVTAPITTVGAPVRWYLWDIDACGHQAFTVHSGFYPTPDAALTDWQAAVGQVAAAGTALAPVDDPWLLAELLPVELGMMRPGGESVEQFAEYHRGKRLAAVVNQAMPQRDTPPDGGLDAATAAVEFTAWLRARHADQQEPPTDMDELVTELANSWSINDIGTVFATCSPHRVALCVLHIRDYYDDEFADQLVALLPDWTRWLATRNGTPAELADRCLPYAQGQPRPQIMDDVGPDYLARVTE